MAVDRPSGASAVVKYRGLLPETTSGPSGWDVGNPPRQTQSHSETRLWPSARPIRHHLHQTGNLLWDHLVSPGSDRIERVGAGLSSHVCRWDVALNTENASLRVCPLLVQFVYSAISPAAPRHHRQPRRPRPRRASERARPQPRRPEAGAIAGRGGIAGELLDPEVRIGDARDLGQVRDHKHLGRIGQLLQLAGHRHVPADTLSFVLLFRMMISGSQSWARGLHAESP